MKEVDMTKKSRKDAPALTEREIQLWEKLASGLSLDEAARAMQINYWTADHDVRQLHRKLNVTTRAELVAAWYQHRAGQ